MSEVLNIIHDIDMAESVITLLDKTIKILFIAFNSFLMMQLVSFKDFKQKYQ